MMVSKAYIIQENGYQKYLDVDEVVVDSTPKFLLSKSFFIADEYSARLLKTLEDLYKNPTIKPIMDVIATHSNAYDKFYITSGINVMQGASGQCEWRSDVGQPIIGIDIQSFLDDKEFPRTLAHEMAHAAALIVFQNNFDGFSSKKEEEVFEVCFRSFAEKVMYITFAKAPTTIYSSVDGVQILKLVAGALSYQSAKYQNSDADEKESEMIDILTSFLGVANYSDNDVRSEIFVRLFEAQAMGTTLLSGKVMKSFDPYISLLNEAIDAYMIKNASSVPSFVKPNADGAYGVAKFWLDDEKYGYDIDEQLYFAVATRNKAEVEKLLEAGADASSTKFLRPAIALPIIRDDKEMMNIILEHSKSINLSAKDFFDRDINWYLEGLAENKAADLLREYIINNEQKVQEQSMFSSVSSYFSDIYKSVSSWINDQSKHHIDQDGISPLISDHMCDHDYAAI